MRVASCHCRSLRLSCEGDPAFVVMCHCESCQRRTGSSYNLGAWYERASVQFEGDEKIYTRTGEDSGSEYRFHFCPSCGANVYWESPSGDLPDMLGIAVGCFADPEFPKPSFSLYGKRRHRWLPQIAGISSFMEATDSELEG